MNKKKIFLIGNPDIRKKNLFNFLNNYFNFLKEKCDICCSYYCCNKKYLKNIKDYDYEIVNLPGIYSLSIYSDNERKVKKFLNENPDLIINVIDSTNIKRNLYLTIQLLEKNKNLIIVLINFKNVKKKYEKIDINLLSELLNTKINIIENYKKIDFENLKNNIMKNIFLYKSNISKKKEFILTYDKEIQNNINDLENFFIKENIKFPEYSRRMIAIGILEKDKDIYQKISKKNKNIIKYVKKKIKYLEKLYNDDLETIFIEQRYKYIEQILENVFKNEAKKTFNYSEKIDKIILHPFWGLFIFFIMMFLVFQITFFCGNYFKNFIELFFKNMSIIIEKNINIKPLVSFLNNGLINGLGIIISFLPNLIIIFLILTFFEESGYMSRVAYLTDRIMRFFGLPGKAFIPLFTGFGCSIPAILSTKILDNKSDRIITILVTSLISCNGRLPLYLLFISILFPEKKQGFILFSIYFLGIFLAVFLAKIFKKFFFKDTENMLILNLSSYNFPNVKFLFLQTWFKIKDFLNHTVKILFFMVIFIWILSFFPVGVVYGSKESLIGKIGVFLSPIFIPIGFGDYPSTIALLSGIITKEGIATTLGTIYGSNGFSITKTISSQWTQIQAYSFLVMSSIYVPCLATLTIIKKETNIKWMVFVIIYSFCLAYIVSFIVYKIGSFFIV